MRRICLMNNKDQLLNITNKELLEIAELNMRMIKKKIKECFLFYIVAHQNDH